MNGQPVVHSPATTNTFVLQIAAVGGQSGGKSTLLESFIGLSVLPRGEGMVTRCPLIVQIVHKQSDDIYFEFPSSKDPSRKFVDPGQVCQMITDETNRLAGRGFGISDQPIVLKVFCDRYPLTLVDLPGLIKVPVAGQPPEVPKKIRQMVEEVIKKPNCLILAVTEANKDLATSDSLQIALEFDPEGRRTIGVLTKMDLADERSEVLQVLEGRIYTLKYGFTGVVCASQTDMNESISREEIKEKEAQFFRERYSQLADRQGTDKLQTKLYHLLKNHIIANRGDVIKQIKQKRQLSKDELNKLTGGKEGHELEPKSQVLQIISQTHRNFLAYMKADHKGVDITKEIFGSALLKRTWKESFNRRIRELDLSTPLTDRQIYTAIVNARTTNADIFPPFQVFPALVLKLIKMLNEPCEECLTGTRNNVEKSLEEVLQLMPEKTSHELLIEDIKRIAIDLLDECCARAKRNVSDFLKAEGCHTDLETFAFEKAKAKVNEMRHHNFNTKIEDADMPAIATAVKDMRKSLHGGVLEVEVWNPTRRTWHGRYATLREKQLKLYQYFGDGECTQVFDLNGVEITMKEFEHRDSIEIKKVSQGYFNKSEELLVTLSGGDKSQTRAWAQICESESKESAGDSPDKDDEDLRISPADALDIKTIEFLLQEYMAAVSMTVMNHVPKQIKNQMVDSFLDRLPEHLIKNLYESTSEEGFQRYAEESQVHLLKKKEVSDRVAKLEESLRLLEGL
eukprot:CAMPEP_0184327552 /NCGR_PEP_ID=MMETSP1049-20130417/143154_1 /TAXON_ID=77928 /ORGANISM="Proteomonas sulcata, Strain CCMP704" /LENGTH=737 /DNA_ID=CAMNT_0026649813 /DNA_START=960 /DNA_END=3173 /DNA_ORIENTATION=-